VSCDLARPAIRWRDLRPLRKWQIVRELTLPLPWLALSLWLAQGQLYLVALPFTFLTFLFSLRLVHDAWHRTLNLPRWAYDIVIVLSSAVMLGSMHAIRLTHLVHHRSCLDHEDIEGRSARMTALRSILSGPVLFLVKHAKAWGLGADGDRRWIAVELLINVVLLVLVFGLLDIPELKYHVLAMGAAQWLFPFFSVWLVHRGCDASHVVARTLRGRLKNLVFAEMLYHAEHHLFPAVPTCRLARLAERIDRAAPELSRSGVFSFSDLDVRAHRVADTPRS